MILVTGLFAECQVLVTMRRRLFSLQSCGAACSTALLRTSVLVDIRLDMLALD
jgi:hypothetical protein